MNIVVAVRCYNEAKNIERFMRGYDFADTIVVSDGGSTDDSVSMLEKYPKVKLLHYPYGETIDGHFWNGDSGHMNFVLNAAKELKPDWLIFDDMDCVPTKSLREDARLIFDQMRYVDAFQVNAFRLYLWGDREYFPHMNRNFDPSYRSLWAWRPDKVNIHADENLRHGTLVGLHLNYYGLDIPNALLHKSWHPDTVQKKVDRYNALGLPADHPLSFAGTPEPLPDWAVE